ncbi:MAG: EAL domain-containing protein [Roseibium sp.]
MNKCKGIRFNWLILSLFFAGLMVTAAILFGITYLGSLSIAELEIERRADRQQSLSSLVFEAHLRQLESQLRTAAEDQDLVEAIKDYDSGRATRVLELLGQNSTGSQPDILILNHERQLGWLNASLALVDVGAVIPSRALITMPPDIWRIYIHEEETPATIIAVIAIPIIDADTGRMIARLIGGSSINDSFSLLNSLANILAVEDLAIVYRDQNVASFGHFSDRQYLDNVLAALNGNKYVIRNDTLFTSSTLHREENGISIHVITSEISDTVQNIQNTYLEIFLPFLVYIAIACVAAVLILNSFTAPSLKALIQHATARRRDGDLKNHEPGQIAEYNLLGDLFDEAFEAVHRTNAQFRELIDGSLQGVVVHADQEILYVNSSMLEMLDYPQDDPSTLVGKSIFSIYAPNEQERLQNYHDLRKSGEVVPTVYDILGMCQSGEHKWLEQHVRMTNWNGRRAFYVTVLDITDRKEQERLIEQHANFDALTGLPNRNLFLDRLRQALSQAEKSDTMGALLMVDLDRFKAFNDIYSHGFGDQILKTIASRMEYILDPSETVARLGGDEFAIILSGLEDEWEIERRSQEILHVVSVEMQVDHDKTANLTTSIGISVFPNDGLNEDALMRQADAAINQAKEDGGNKFRFFSTKRNERAARALQLETALRKAIDDDMLQIHIQPVIEIINGTIFSCEALARWDDPDLGSIAPGEFIPIAEETGLIVPLGQAILKKACEFYQECSRRGFEVKSISVNISPRQCREDGLINSISTILDETGIPARNLHLEITESVMFDDNRIDPVSLLRAIKSLGVKISLDDFGTGYSSLSYLKRLPIDTLKIDRSFIMDLENDADDQALVNAIVTMADTLSIGVICEGVETRQQNDILKEMGCRYIQGYYFGRPMPADAFFEFLIDKPYKTEAERKVS